MREMWPRIHDRITPVLVGNALNQFYSPEVLPNPPGWVEGRGLPLWDKIVYTAAYLAQDKEVFEKCLPGISAMTPGNLLSPDPEPVLVVYLYFVCQMATLSVMTGIRHL